MAAIHIFDSVKMPEHVFVSCFMFTFKNAIYAMMQQINIE